VSAKITVVTAVLNQAEALRDTVQSILNQSYPNLDYIIIDGGSTDGTVDVVRDNENWLAGWRSAPDSGVYHAMNKGWDMADAESYLLFLGAGDCLLSLPTFLPEPGNDPIAYFGAVMLRGGQRFTSYAGWRLKMYNSLHHQGLLIPKKIHLEPPFDTRFRLYADFDFNQRMKKQGIRFSCLGELSAYASPHGMTSATDLSELLIIVRKNYGRVWQGLSFAGFGLAGFFPFLKKFRPIK